MDFRRISTSRMNPDRDFAIKVYDEGDKTVAKIHSPEHGWGPQIDVERAIATAGQQGKMDYDYVVIDDDGLWKEKWGKLEDWDERLVKIEGLPQK